MKPTRPFLAAIAAFVASALVLTACGSGDESPNSSQSSAAPSTAPSSAGSGGSETPKPSTHDSVRIAVDPMITLDPAVARGQSTDRTIMVQIYSSLLRFAPNGEIVGDLATKWEATGATEWTFKIVDDAKFVDGTPLTAQTVVWNIERLQVKDNPFPNTVVVQKVKKATAVDDTTVVFETTIPWPELPRAMTQIWFLDPTWAATHNPAIEALPSGPYDLVSWSMDDKIVLKANEKYYGEAPSIPNVTYKVFANAATKLAAMQAGELDVIASVQPIDVPQLESLGTIKIDSPKSSGHHILRFNLNNEALKDVRVRQAFNYAIDKEAITSSLYRGLVGPLTTQLLAPGFAGYDDTRKPWPYDPAEAKKLLAEAGYSSGLELEMAVPEVSNFVSAGEAAQIIAAQLAEVGVKITLRTIPANRWAEFQRTKETAPDMIYQGFGSSAMSSVDLLSFFETAGIYTWGPQPAELDEAVAKIKAATSEDEIATLAKEITEIMYQDALLVYLWPRPQVNAMVKDLNWPGRSDTFIVATEMSWNS